jgi:hypothetical protein
VIDRIVKKPAMLTLLAACAGVATLAGAQFDVPVGAGAIATSPAAKAVLGAYTPTSAALGGSGVPVLPDWGSSGQNNHNTRRRKEVLGDLRESIVFVGAMRSQR